jgi:hypothetical protein
MNYYLVILASTFGHASNKPLRKALFKLGSLSVTSLTLGVLLSRSMPHLPHEAGFSWIYWSVSAIFVAQIVTLFSLLPAMGISNTANEKLSCLLLVLPFKQRQRRLMLLAPSIVLVGIGLLFASPMLAALLLPTGMWPGILAIAVLAGSLSAFGLVYGHTRGSATRIIATSIVLFLEYKLAAAVHTSQNRLPWALLFSVLALALCAIACRSGKYFEGKIKAVTKADSVHGSNAPGWFAKKFLRSPITLLSLGMTFTLSLGVALIYSRQKLLDVQLLALVSSVLAAGLASDIRAISRRIWPAEITMVRGSSRFVAAELITIVAACSAAVGPLLCVTIGSHTWNTTTHVLFGTAVGFVASTILVPTKRDITSQAAAGLLCIALTLLPSKIAPVNTPIVLIALAIVLSSAAFLIEHKRNPYIWRHYAN